VEQHLINGGFKEIVHTADLSLKVWATELSALFTISAQGMFSLMKISMCKSEPNYIEVNINEIDLECLLVKFLSFLLEEIQKNAVVYDIQNILFAKNSLSATLRGFPIILVQRDIKAVTFHNLEVIYEKGTYQATLVFDI